MLVTFPVATELVIEADVPSHETVIIRPVPEIPLVMIHIVSPASRFPIEFAGNPVRV
jgi:hypothetical protein